MVKQSILKLNKTKHPFRKKWGQNFLRDPNTIAKIVSLLNLKQTDTILEVGPGDGALTDIISEKAGHVHVVEIDPLLITKLKRKKYRNVVIHEGDILNWDMSILPEKIKIIGNLPYYISSPILFHFLMDTVWERMIFMFQKELAERITSKEGSKLYGRISVICQVFCHVQIIFNVSRNIFQPKPDVDSSVLLFYPKDIDLPNRKQFSSFIRQSFSQRRKKLKNNLPQAYERGVIKKWAHMRPEEINPQEFVQIYKMIYLG